MDDLLQSHGTVYVDAIAAMRSASSNNIEVVHGKDVNGNSVKLRLMRPTTRFGTVVVALKEKTSA